MFLPICRIGASVHLDESTTCEPIGDLCAVLHLVESILLGLCTTLQDDIRGREAQKDPWTGFEQPRKASEVFTAQHRRGSKPAELFIQQKARVRISEQT